MYECSGCGKKFKTTHWLSRHQGACDARNAFVKAEARKFQKAEGMPKKSRNLLSTFNSWISGHQRTENSREELVGVSELPSFSESKRC
jgi:hypothetical protein